MDNGAGGGTGGAISASDGASPPAMRTVIPAYGGKRQPVKTPQGSMMKYATLVIGRTKYRAVAVTEDGESRELLYEEAKDYHSRVISAPWVAFNSNREAAQSKRATFKEACEVRTNQEALEEYNAQPRRFGMVKGDPPEQVDFVLIEERTHKIPKGTANRFIEEEAYRRYPDPQPPSGKCSDFDQWFNINSKDKRTWKAEFIRGERSELLVFDALDWSWGYPIAAAMRELDRLAREGWKLVHVSEDHGLYAGADAADEAYLTRVRYLLSAD
jgi:hypothetical protein